MTQHPTILQVIPGLHTGGAERTALDIGNTLVEKGWRSLVASAGGRLLPKLIEQKSEHFELPLDSKNPVTIWRNAGKLEALIKQQNVNLIHARSRAPAWSALIAARRTGIPFVTTYHGAYNEKGRLKALYNSVMARADIVIANSGWTADLIRERNPFASKRIVVIHRGTNFTEFDKSNISKERLDKLRKQWGVNPDELIVVQLARMTWWKGQSTVIDAAAKLGMGKYVRFILAGDSQGRESYIDELNSKISQYGLENQVTLPGHCDDPEAAMALADVVIVASTEAEAFGRAAVEAGALEKPVIVTRIGAVVETVLAEPETGSDEITGWKIPPNDPDAMADTLQSVLSMSPAERAAVGKRARAFGQEHFSVEQMCSRTIEVYESLLD